MDMWGKHWFPLLRWRKWAKGGDKVYHSDRVRIWLESRILDSKFIFDSVTRYVFLTILQNSELLWQLMEIFVEAFICRLKMP